MMTKIPVKNMSREEWLEHRRNTIGGSDAAAVLGLHKYRSPYSLWAEKTGKVIPADISDREAVRLGNDLEAYVAQRWMEATGRKLRRENNMLYNSEYPFAHADIDRAVIGEKDAGFEAKTTSSYDVLRQCMEGKYPDMWYCQMMHYMMVTGAKRWYLGVLCLGHGFFHFTVERNEAEIEALSAAERDFWELVANDTPPGFLGAADEAETLEAIIGDEIEEGMIPLVGLECQLTLFREADRQIKELKKTKEAAKNEICSAIGENMGGYIGGTKVVWKPQTHSTFQADRFREDYPEIDLTDYYRTTVSRKFTVGRGRT